MENKDNLIQKDESAEIIGKTIGGVVGVVGGIFKGLFNMFGDIIAENNPTVKTAQLILDADISENEKVRLLRNLLRLNGELNVLITGCTGCGKSSTINAIFNAEKAKVGIGCDPETMNISKYKLDNLILWDSPGLGDGRDADARHRKNIINKLIEKGENGFPLINLVLVIVDGSCRDMGSDYELINNVLIPNFKESRILVAINKADMTMSGRNWDFENHRPNPTLKKFLDDKAISVKTRIKEATGLDVKTIYYSAGYKEEGREQEPAYNLSALLFEIIKKTI